MVETDRGYFLVGELISIFSGCIEMKERDIGQAVINTPDTRRNPEVAFLVDKNIDDSGSVEAKQVIGFIGEKPELAGFIIIMD
jgi:hypothetical protein